MMFCCLVLRAGRTRFGCRLLAGLHPFAPTPVVGRVDQRSAHHTHHLLAEEVARPWTGVQAAEQSRVSRFGDLATRLEFSPIGMTHPGNPFGAT
jgi:hypothetical protein